MPGPDLLPLEEARARILEDVLPLRPVAVPLAECRGRVLAEEASALITLPPWDNSAMDGYAVRSEDVVGGLTRDAGDARGRGRGRGRARARERRRRAPGDARADRRDDAAGR